MHDNIKLQILYNIFRLGGRTIFNADVSHPVTEKHCYESLRGDLGILNSGIFRDEFLLMTLGFGQK